MPTPTEAPTPLADFSVLGVWVDKAQPDTVQIEFGSDDQVQFRVRIKTTIQGQEPTYSEWSTLATIPWKQDAPDSLIVGSGDQSTRWQIDIAKGSLLQPTSSGDIVEFIRP